MSGMDPAFRNGLRAAYDIRLPQWTDQAACRSASLPDTPHPSNRARTMSQQPGMPSDVHFLDDLTAIKNIENYDWPATVIDAMRVCGECPVRQPCLAYAFDIEQTTPDYAASWASTFEQQELPMRFGIYGGAPGPVRERFAPMADRLGQVAAWFARVALSRRWALLADDEDMSA